LQTAFENHKNGAERQNPSAQSRHFPKPFHKLRTISKSTFRLHRAKPSP
jgi:hypothetical protein